MRAMPPDSGAVSNTATVTTSGPAAAEPPNSGSVSSGAYALSLIQRQTRRLGTLQPDVLADRDPEAIHQLRVSLRRLRTVLTQFGPALALPDGVNPRRIAAVARRTGLCRDLDVLRLRLDSQLLPLIPEPERLTMRGAIKRLARDRDQAFDTLVEALRGPRYLKLLARLRQWQHQPHFTPLGHGQLAAWLYEWQAPFSADLLLHSGWQVEDPEADALHDLRKRIKGARYALESLEPWCGPALIHWIAELKQAQDHLGELHDLQVLSTTLNEWQRSQQRQRDLPVLQATIHLQRQEHWFAWRAQALRLLDHGHRRLIHSQLLALGGPDRASPWR